MSDRLKIGAGLVLVAAAVVLFLVLRGNGSDSDVVSGTSSSKQTGGGTEPAKPSIPVIRLKGGEPVGGLQELEVTSGERVHFKVTSDIEGEVHVHGYDIEKPVKAGGSVDFDFPADLEGGFEVEMHHGGGENPIADLKVQPG